MPENEVVRLHEQTAARVQQIMSDLFAQGRSLDELGTRVRDAWLSVKRLRGLSVDPGDPLAGIGPSHIDSFLIHWRRDIDRIAELPDKPVPAMKALRAAYRTLNDYLDGLEGC